MRLGKVEFLTRLKGINWAKVIRNMGKGGIR